MGCVRSGDTNVADTAVRRCQGVLIYVVDAVGFQRPRVLYEGVANAAVVAAPIRNLHVATELGIIYSY